MKVIKVIVLLVVLLVVVVFGGIAAFIGFADPNDFKGMIAERVAEATGRQLTLQGPLEWAFWPKIKLHASGIALSNAEGFGDAPFFAADEIQVAVATLPLLSKRVEMDTVVLHGLAVNLARNADGVSNWDDLGAAGETEQEDRGGMAAIILGGVDVQNARFSYSDATSGQELVISNLNASTGALTFGDPVDFKLSLTAVANQPALDSDLVLNGTVSYDIDEEHYVITPLALNTVLRGKQFPGGKTSIDFGAAIDINLAEETLTVSDLKLDGLGTSVVGAFKATDIEAEKPSAAGQLTIKGADLAAIFNAFELPLGRQLDDVKDRSFDFDVAFDANMDTGEVVVSKLAGNALGAQLAGSFNATDANTDKPRATGSLNASGPDLPTLLAVVGQLQGADAETLRSLRQALAGARDKSFSITADLDANLAEGKADLPTLEAKLLGNTITGRVNAIHADTDKPAVKASLNAAGPDFPTLLTAIATLQGADAATLKSLDSALKGAADKTFTVTADIDADLAKGTASLPKLNAKLLGNSISGQVQASNIDKPKPAAKGTLSASGADLPALLAIAAQLQKDGKGMRDLAAGLAKEKDRSFNLDISFDTDLGAGRIDLEKLSADLLGLQIRGGLKGSGVDFDTSKGSLDGNIKVTSKDLGPLLRSSDNADLAKSLKTLNLDAGLKGTLSDLTIAPFSLTTLVSSPEVPKPVELKLTAGSAQANLEKDTLSLKNVAVTGLGLNAKADVEVSKLSAAPRYSGTLDVPAFNLRSLLKSLNKPVPKTADPKALSRVAMNSKFTGTPSSIKLDGFKIMLDDTSIKGDLDVASFEGPDLKFGIGIDRIDADRYLEPTPKGKARPATPEAAAAGAASELPVETLRALKIKGDLLIGDLVLSGAKMKNIKFSIDANGGVIKLAPMGADLYDGKYAGAITLNARGKQTVLNLNTKLDGVNVEPLIRDTVENDMLAGIVSFDAALKGVGGDADRLKKTLSGDGKFKTTNGIFRGVDAAAVLRAVEQIIECKCPVPIPKGGETRFDTLTGTLNVKNGVIRNEDLLLSGKGFTITGKGMLANLQNNTVKYDLTLAVPRQAKQAGVSDYNLGGYEVPIRCSGQLDDPKCLPDAGGILKAVAKSAVKDKVGDTIKDAVGGEAGEAIKNLLKF